MGVARNGCASKSTAATAIQQCPVKQDASLKKMMQNWLSMVFGALGETLKNCVAATAAVSAAVKKHQRSNTPLLPPPSLT